MRTRFISLLSAAALVLAVPLAVPSFAQAAATATITGTVTPADAVNLQVLACPATVITHSNCDSADVKPDGSYSIEVQAGSSVTIYASSATYYDTWYGGYPSSAACGRMMSGFLVVG